MKSKAVASILRHVASKVPSLTHGSEGEKEVIQSEPQAEKENKRATRKARQVAQGDEAAILEGDHDVSGGANEEEKLEKLYEQVAWPLGKKYGHPYDAFKLALTYVWPNLVFVNPLTGIYRN